MWCLVSKTSVDCGLQDAKSSLLVSRSNYMQLWHFTLAAKLHAVD